MKSESKKMSLEPIKIRSFSIIFKSNRCNGNTGFLHTEFSGCELICHKKEEFSEEIRVFTKA